MTADSPLLSPNSQLGRELHRRFDEYGAIQVFDDGNKRFLSFGTTDEQSCLLLSHPTQLQHEYNRAMMSVLCQFPLDDMPQQALIMGLGGGSLARALLALLPDITLDAVELRPAVTHIAHQYFELPRTPQLKVHHQDALSYLSKPAERSSVYDLIFSDLYLADGLNEQQLDSDFIPRCKQHLSQRGWLVLNLWKEHRDNAALLAQLKAEFTTLMHTTTKDGNWTIWASQQPPIAQTEARRHCKHWQASLLFNAWHSAKGFYRHWS